MIYQTTLINLKMLTIKAIHRKFMKLKAIKIWRSFYQRKTGLNLLKDKLRNNFKNVKK